MAIPEPIPKRSDIAKGLRTVYLNRVAHMGMMLDKVQRNQRAAERLQQFAASGKIGDLRAPDEEQDMGVYIGNEIYLGYGQEEEPATIPIGGEVTPAPIAMPAAPPATPVAEPPLWGAQAPPAKLSWPAKALIAAGALGTGMGVGAIANEYWYGRPDPPAAVVDTDTDNITEVDFPE